MRAQGLADAWPLSITKNVDNIQIGRNELLERAVGHQGFNGAVLVVKALSGPRQADTPLGHERDLGAKDDLVLIDSRLAQTARRSSPILMGLGLPFFLR